MGVLIYKNERPDIERAILDNDGYCCCAIEKTADTKCMCKDFKELYEGECHCGLFRKVRTHDK